MKRKLATIRRVQKARAQSQPEALQSPPGYVYTATVPTMAKGYQEIVRANAIRQAIGFLSAAICRHGEAGTPRVLQWPCPVCRELVRRIVQAVVDGVVISGVDDLIPMKPPSEKVPRASKISKTASKTANRTASASGRGTAKPGRRTRPASDPGR